MNSFFSPWQKINDSFQTRKLYLKTSSRLSEKGVKTAQCLVTRIQDGQQRSKGSIPIAGKALDLSKASGSSLGPTQWRFIPGNKEAEAKSWRLNSNYGCREELMELYLQYPTCTHGVTLN